MPVRLGQFYAFVLLLACLVTNVVFFSEIREPFLGDEDPLASIKSAFSELDFKESIADFYSKVQSNVEGDTSSEVSKEEKPTTKERNRQSALSPAKLDSAAPIIDSVPPPEPEPEKTVRKEEPSLSQPVSTSAETLQTAAAMPIPQPGTAKPVVADRFRPITSESKSMGSAKSSKPSSTLVWDTVDTVLERPIRYD